MENELNEAVPKYDYITTSQYLKSERMSEYKSEYFQGYVNAVSGASLKHNITASNLASKIGHFLNEANCRMLQSEMRVSTPSHDSYMYPGAVIVCGEPALEDDKFDTFLNPSVIFEILVARRQSDQSWKFDDMAANGLELSIQTINFKLALEAIYNGSSL
ncbi:MAG TPA: Uma2 family endonuclease [Chitinophagaceae bacterium]